MAMNNLNHTIIHLDIEVYIVDCNFTFQQPQLFFPFFNLV